MVTGISELLEAHARSSRLSETERRHVARCQELVKLGNAAISREHLEPGHFTASAFVLSPCKGELLLIRHAKLRRWLQPGGHFEPADASVEAAARREVQEEVGLSDATLANAGLFDVDVHQIPANPKQAAHEHFDLRLLFQAHTRRINAGSDADAARWIGLEDVQRWQSDASVMRAVGQLLRRAR